MSKNKLLSLNSIYQLSPNQKKYYKKKEERLRKKESKLNLIQSTPKVISKVILRKKT